MQQLTTPRLFWPDAVRCCALCLVVMIHVCAPIVVTNYYSIPHGYWWLATAIDALARPGAPLFFMLSGALLLGKVSNESAKIFLKKRIYKVLLPFLGWSIFYTIWKIMCHDMPFSLSSFISILSTPVFYHLWFFYSIIALYLIAPLFAGAKQQVYYFVFWLWLIMVCSTFCLKGIINLEFNGNFTSIVPQFLGYFIAGYLLHNMIFTRQKLIYAWVVLLISYSITLAGTGWFTLRNNGIYDSFFFEYINFNIVAMTLSAFFLLKTWSERVACTSKTTDLIRMISKYSLGIYAVHPAILLVLTSSRIGFKLNAYYIHPILGIPITFTVTLLISICVIYILTKIPFVKKIV